MSQGDGDLLGVRITLTDGVADHHDGGPVRLQQQLASSLLQQPVERGRRTSEHLPAIFAFPFWKTQAQKTLQNFLLRTLEGVSFFL
jgi:hypothetical protein